MKQKMQDLDLITLSTAAREAGVSRRTLQNHMKAGSAPEHRRIGREVVFSLAEVQQWKADRYPEGKPRKGRRHL
jgi:predicted DNA-binding transcriptional regulator AlpA